MKRAWVLTLAAIFVGVWIPALFLLGRQEEPEGTLPPEPVQTAPADRTEAVQTVPSGDSLDGTMLLQVLMSDGTVEQKPLDDYLAGVILAEMPASFEEEALKAQAVVSRTYTLRQTARNKHDSADICTDPGCCQGWISYEDYCAKAGEAGPDGAQAAAQAVKATDGQVLVYDGGLIDATFFSCSGGRTETAVEVWGSDVPYLQSVDSPGEEAPHIVFTPYLRALAAQLTEGIASPAEKAKRIYDYVTLNVRYHFQPSYFVHESIAENCARTAGETAASWR